MKAFWCLRALQQLHLLKSAYTTANATSPQLIGICVLLLKCSSVSTTEFIEHLQQKLEEKLSIKASCVSPKVALLISTSNILLPKGPKAEAEYYLNEDGTLRFDRFTRDILLGDRAKDELREEETYFLAAPHIKRASIAIHKKLFAMSKEEFIKTYQSKFFIFEDEEVIHLL
jgi:hypothetical protein